MYQEGNYTAKVTAQRVTTSTKGTLQFELEILPTADDDGPIQGNVFRRTLYFPLTPATLGTAENPGWVAITLAAPPLNFQGRDYKQLDPDCDGCQSFIDLEVQVYVKHEEYNEQTRERWNLSKSRKAKQKASADAWATLEGSLGAPAAPAKPDDGKDVPF